MSKQPVKLTEWTTCGGCAAKWGGSPLGDLLRTIAGDEETHGLLVGLAPFDDAAVLRLSDDLALVSTTDFFPPLVDDPGDFGAVAAANACSDVFAMGGRVTLALNICAFPERLPVEVITAILAAAAQTVAEAGGVIAGGHTIRSEEPIFGLAVQGLVHPDRILTKRGARPGDAVVLSKPLGTGIVLADGSPENKAAVVAGMRTLNRSASEFLQELGGAIHAVTDVTGFGLAGHSWEIAERSNVAVRLDADRLPLYPGAAEAAAAGIRTGGDARNHQYLGDKVDIGSDQALEAIAFDPQTSGGLLAAIDPGAVSDLLDRGFWEIGTVVPGAPMVTLR
jgi:selenide, water dikinase